MIRPYLPRSSHLAAYIGRLRVAELCSDACFPVTVLIAVVEATAQKAFRPLFWQENMPGSVLGPARRRHPGTA